MIETIVIVGIYIFGGGALIFAVVAIIVELIARWRERQAIRARGSK
jgi:hypothetical protein